MPPRRPWSDGLPPELLGVILLHLNCLADRVYFATVCRAWRSAAQAFDGPPRQLPWLLLPSGIAPSFFSPHSGAIRPIHLPDGVQGARLCGSHDGGWIAVAVDTWQRYAAVNLISGVRVPLPDRLRIFLPDNHLGIATPCEFPMLIRTVTFSAAPTSEGCLAAAHVASASNIAFWRLGMDGHWLAYPLDGGGLQVQDIIYHRNELKQGFHVLSDNEDVLVYTPHGDPHAPLEMSSSSYKVRKRADYTPDGKRVTRYLVESRGKLLMVLRHYTKKKARYIPCRTFKIRIFEMKFRVTHHGGSKVSWKELHKLPGRVIFLGRGCSRAFEVSQFNSLQGGTIFYLDDARFDMSVLLNSESKYSSTDMGMGAFRKHKEFKNLKRRGCARLFPRKFTSECSSPIWFVP